MSFRRRAKRFWISSRLAVSCSNLKSSGRPTPRADAIFVRILKDGFCWRRSISPRNLWFISALSPCSCWGQPIWVLNDRSLRPWLTHLAIFPWSLKSDWFPSHPDQPRWWSRPFKDTRFIRIYSLLLVWRGGLSGTWKSGSGLYPGQRGLLLPHRRGQGAGPAGLPAGLPGRHPLLRLLFAGEGRGRIV